MVKLVEACNNFQTYNHIKINRRACQPTDFTKIEGNINSIKNLNGFGQGWNYHIKAIVKEIKTDHKWNFGPKPEYVEKEVEKIR